MPNRPNDSKPSLDPDTDSDWAAELRKEQERRKKAEEALDRSMVVLDRVAQYSSLIRADFKTVVRVHEKTEAQVAVLIQEVSKSRKACESCRSAQETALDETQQNANWKLRALRETLSFAKDNPAVFGLVLVTVLAGTAIAALAGWDVVGLLGGPSPPP